MTCLMRARLLQAVPLMLMLAIVSCSSDKTTKPAVDASAPAAVADLAAGSPSPTSVHLTWTAPGDDDTTGTAKQYDIRYATAMITEANWASAAQATGEPAPGIAGTAQTFTVAGLTPNTPYFFAVKTADEVPNWSVLSNVPTATTSPAPDTTAPSGITTLTAGSPTPTSVNLAWTAPGDDGDEGTASQYDLRYATVMITEANWAAATQVTGEPVPREAGGLQTFTVTGLTPNTPYYFAIKAADEVPNWSALSNVRTATTLPGPDTTAPAAIADLSGAASGSTSVLLLWTAPGDDGGTGTAAQYEIRYASTTITESTWSSATPVTDLPPAPELAGTSQQMTVHNLQSDRDYHFAIKTRDEVPNVSAVSNDALVHTPPTADAPPVITFPDTPDSVCITGDSPYATAAKILVERQLAMLDTYANLASTFLLYWNALQWQHGTDCWTSSYAVGGCTWQYRVCQEGSIYTYTTTHTGICYAPYDFKVVMDQSSNSGTFYIYNQNTTDVFFAWTWTTASDGNSGEIKYYSSDPATSPEEDSSLTWARSADGNTWDMTYREDRSIKWVTHMVKNPCSGWIMMYDYDSAFPGDHWWLTTHIIWNADGTGSYDTYTEDHQPPAFPPEEHHTW